MASEVYAQLDKSWKATCRIIFGSEVGELSEYATWLREYCPTLGKRTSVISGKPVILAGDHYSQSAKFISEDERREKTVKINALNINDIKDIDSVSRAISEEWEYTGNRMLGNSSAVEGSDMVIDSQFVHDSSNIQETSNAYSSFMIRQGSKCTFGSGLLGQGQFLIRTIDAYNINRCFESDLVVDSSDIYLSHYCSGCSEIMFSFFQRGKRNVIGNLQLPKDRYLTIKKKLLAEIAEELKHNKRFPSLYELTTGKTNGTATVPPKINPPNSAPQPLNLAHIEKAFSTTFSIMLRQEPGSITQYENWLTRHCAKIVEVKTVFGNSACFPVGSEIRHFSFIPKGRLISRNEGFEIEKLHLRESDLSSLSKVCDRLSDIAYFTIEFNEGNNAQNFQTPVVFNATHTYKTYDATYSEYVGNVFFCGNSKYIFGGTRALRSEFCINCHNSLYLTRCLEADTSTKCSDSYFCHNSEGLQDTMFCFNVKGKRQAIGNTQLQTEQYAKLKGTLLGQIADELIKKKTTHLDIFTIGAGGN